jgi:hypothetical protein
MGKKRRLKSAKAKFSTKHASHPRMQNLNREEVPEVEATSPDPEPEVVVVLQEEKNEIKPKPPPKPKTAKKPRRTTRKKTTKKIEPIST